jgi:hypothetical protein
VADLVVDYSLLGRSEASLRALISEFSNVQTQENAYAGAWGSDDIAAAMGDFASNWDYHRKQLLASMESLSAMVSQSRAGFAKADTSLAGDLTRKH